MNKQTASPLRVSALVLALAALLDGCSVMDVEGPTLKAAEAVKTGPQNAPYRAITNFSAALRCMDNTMIVYGVRDTSMLVEELADQTKKVNAGTRDMLISAVSDMTKRSRGIRLIAFGRDSGNLVDMLEAAGSKTPYATIPQFDIKGSISQFDENVAKKTAEAGFAISDYFSAGYAKSANATVLGIDLSVLDTSDMSVVPGVTSRNAVIIFKQGKGLDADAQYKKFGINFSTTLSKAEGNTQALRNLIELASIELIGKLTRTPYWQCLGADAASPEVRQEIDDWFETLSGPDTIAYFQYQLRLRGVYDGPVDQQANPALIQAVTRYRRALGLSEEAKIDQAFYSAYLNADHKAIEAQARLATPAPLPVPQEPPGQAGTPPSITIADPRGRTRYGRGEQFELAVNASQNSHVYCYLQDETRAIQRFYPNRFKRDSYLKAGETLQLPGRMGFQLLANTRGVKETVACYATARDVLAELPQSVVGIDFEKLPATSLDTVRESFQKATRGAMAEDYYHVDIK